MRFLTRKLSLAASLWLAVLPAAPVLGQSAPPERLGLEQAVEQALASNLELAARTRALEADRRQIDNERAALLPHVGVGGRAQVIDTKRSDDSRGNNAQRALIVAAGVDQVLYDEDDWATYRIQEHTYEGQTQQFRDFELGLVQQAADAFLELDRNRALLEIQQRNRELTASNLETTRARVATGYSSERELLRWQAQLAQNDQSVTLARTRVLVNRFALNRVRNRAREEAVDPRAVDLDAYGFVYANETIVQSIAAPEGDRKLRDTMVRIGAERSPVIAELDADIAAEERLLTANERSFWMPTLTAQAGVDHVATSSSTTGDFEQTEWIARVNLAFPIFEGGARFSKLSQSGERLSGLRLARRAAVESVDEQVRSGFAQASGSFANIGFAARQEGAARKNYEFVDEGYVLGVVSILDLLDAQSQLLDARVGAVNARYDFLADLVAAERALGFYPFLERGEEVEVLATIERQL
jgi:outer membrane protein